MCSNTIEDQILENVSVVTDPIEGIEVFAKVSTIPLGTMPLGQFGSTFVSYKRAQVGTKVIMHKTLWWYKNFDHAGIASSCKDGVHIEVHLEGNWPK